MADAKTVKKVIGIDLGTTNSCVAVLEGGQPHVIPNAQGGRTTPSVVSFKAGEEPLVGDLAKRQAVTNATNTIYSIKRFMGHRLSDDGVGEVVEKVPYSVKAGNEGRAQVEVGGREYQPEAISAMILAKLKADAEAYLGETVDEAVVTVPAYFNDAGKTATLNAAEAAGFKEVRIVNEPTAAAMAYGVNGDKDGTVLVFDLGGGTFDVSLLEITTGLFKVKATSGDAQLGGDNYNECLVDWMADNFKRAEGIDLRQDTQALQRLVEAAEKAKIELSTAPSTSINLPFITANAEGPKHLQQELTKQEFEAMTKELTDKCRTPFETVLEKAGISVGDIDEVVLVGGSTRMPAVQQLVRELTGKEPNRGINPDEAVAAGAAVQGGVLGGELRGKVTLVDVTPLAIGLETAGGLVYAQIDANTPIPIESAGEIYTTAVDNQPSFQVHVLQGPMTKDEAALEARCHSLGDFTLGGITQAPERGAWCRVKLGVDVNGIVTVVADEMDGPDERTAKPVAGKKLTQTVGRSTSLSKDEIERIAAEAQTHKADDAATVARIEAKNRASNVLHQTPKWIEENEAILSDDDREEIATLVSEVEDARDRDDTPALEQATTELVEKLDGIAERGAATPDEAEVDGDDVDVEVAGDPVDAQSPDDGVDEPEVELDGEVVSEQPEASDLGVE